MALPRDILGEIFGHLDREIDRLRFASTCKQLNEYYRENKKLIYKKKSTYRVLSCEKIKHTRFLIEQWGRQYTIIVNEAGFAEGLKDSTIDEFNKIYDSHIGKDCIFVFGFMNNHNSTESSSRRTIKPFIQNNKVKRIDQLHYRLIDEPFCKHYMEGRIMCYGGTGHVKYAHLYHEYELYIEHAPLPEFIKKIYFDTINIIKKDCSKNPEFINLTSP